jgi:hypothetical protein
MNFLWIKKKENGSYNKFIHIFNLSGQALSRPKENIKLKLSLDYARGDKVTYKKSSIIGA